MKYALIFLLLSVVTIGKANRIDGLQNEADIEKFIVSVDNDIRKNMDRWPVKILSNQELLTATKFVSATHAQLAASWIKADLNDDGQTDLIAYTKLYGVLIVMDTGKDSYQVIRLKSFPSLPFVGVGKTGGRTVLLAQHSDCGDYDASKNRAAKRPDTLIYKFGQFVELDHSPANDDIASVTIFTGLCALGPCQSYKLVVEANGQARYVAGTEIPKQGVFTGQLIPSKTNQIMGLVNYMKVKDMEDRYQPGCIMDGGGWQLVVTFKNGAEKQIVDFNGGGTFGLEALYVLMDEIAKTQTWKQIK